MPFEVKSLQGENVSRLFPEHTHPLNCCVAFNLFEYKAKSIFLKLKCCVPRRWESCSQTYSVQTKAKLKPVRHSGSRAESVCAQYSSNVQRTPIKHTAEDAVMTDLLQWNHHKWQRAARTLPLPNARMVNTSASPQTCKPG